MYQSIQNNIVWGGAYNTHINILSLISNYLNKIILFKLCFYLTNLIYKELDVPNFYIS